MENLKNFKYFLVLNDLCKTLTKENFDCIVSKNTQIYKFIASYLKLLIY